jgi:hypothetical protein
LGSIKALEQREIHEKIEKIASRSNIISNRKNGFGTRWWNRVIVQNKANEIP